MTWQEMAKDILSTLNIGLSEEQADVFYSDAKIKFLGAGEGSGKSFMGALTAICRSIAASRIYGLEKQLIWIVGRDFEDANKIVDYLHGAESEWLRDLGIFDKDMEKISTISSHKDQKAIIRTNIGITFETISAYDSKKIGRDQPDGVVGEEVSRWETIEIWRRVKGRLARKWARSWGYFSGSFETAEGWFPDVFKLGEGPNVEQISSFSIPSWANRAIYPLGWDDPAIQMLFESEPEDRFWERYGGKAATPQDSVLPEFRSMLHVSELAELIEDEPVYLFTDPGDEAYAILFVQLINNEVHIVDMVYTHMWTHQAIVNECQLRPAWKHLAPAGHVIDIAGFAVHHGLGNARDAWINDPGITFVGKKRAVDDKLNKLRSVLAVNPSTQRPYLLIHPRCKGIIAEAGSGTNPLPGHGRWRMMHGKPEPRNCDAWDALGYGLLWHFGTKNPTKTMSSKPMSYLETTTHPSFFGSKKKAVVSGGVSYIGAG
jgi:hypothetical protein